MQCVKVGYSVLRHTSVRLFIAAIVIFLGLFAVRHSGNYLVVNHPERSDVIVVLAGDHNDLDTGMHLSCFAKVTVSRWLWMHRRIKSMGAHTRNTRQTLYRNRPLTKNRGSESARLRTIQLFKKPRISALVSRRCILHRNRHYWSLTTSTHGAHSRFCALVSRNSDGPLLP